MPVSVDRGVDNAQTILLPLCDRHLIITAPGSIGTLHDPIDQSIVRDRRTHQAVQSTPVHCERRLVKPIRDGQHTEVLIVVGSCRTVDDDGADDTVAILRAVV